MAEEENLLQYKIMYREKLLELEHTNKEFREFQAMSQVLETELESELENVMVAKIELEREKVNLKDKVSKLNSELEIKNKEIDSKSKDLENTSKILQSKLKEIESLKSIPKVKAESTDMDRRVLKLEEELQAICRELENVKTAKLDVEKDKKYFRDKCDRLESESSEKSKEIDSLLEAKKEMEKDKRILKKRIEKSEADISSKSRMKTLENPRKSYKRSLNLCSCR